MSSKLTHNWHGPFRILAKKSPVNYLLDSNDERSYSHVVHVNRLKPFISPDIRPEQDLPYDIDDQPNEENVLTENEQEITERDDEDEQDPAELAVKAILDKKIIKNRSGRRQTLYLVQWEDKDIEPSWEPLRNLHCGELLKEFETSLLAKKTS